MRNHVLIVEDDEMVQAFVALHLENEGYIVSKAATGGEGLDILAGEEIDLVLLDLNLPDGDGLSIAQKIRETSSVPIIILTARKGQDDKLMGLGLGADEYLTKPIDPKELFLRVRNLLDRDGKIPGSFETTAPVSSEENTKKSVLAATATHNNATGGGDVAAPSKGGPYGLILMLMVLGILGGASVWWIFGQDQDAAVPPNARGDLPLETYNKDSQRLPEVEPDHPLAAKSYSWVLKSKCGKLPYVSWWKAKTLPDIVGYVNQRYAGNWKSYINDWTSRLIDLQDSYSRGKGVRTPEGEVLSGLALKGQIDKTQKRLNVIICLSREAAEYSHRKNVPTR